MFRPYTIFLFLLMAFSGLKALHAQDLLLQSRKKYIIGGIEVTGIKNFNKQTVISFTGLAVGQPITIPGDQVTTIIKKLWGLQLFNNVNIYVNKIEGDNIFLEIYVEELPRLSKYKIEGVSKSDVKDIEKNVELKQGKRINQNFVANTQYYITKKYKDKGFVDAKVAVVLLDDNIEQDTKRMLISVNKGKKIKIQHINITGNKNITDNQVRGALKKTKQKFLPRFYKRSKFIESNYREDLEKVIARFKESGYRDARVLSDSIYRKGKFLNIDLHVEEGDKYYFGDISFIGNTVFTDYQLAQVLGLKKGDVYNGVLLEKRISDTSNPDAEDIANTYQNSGYLFSQINPVEVAVKNDTIDIEVRISEGKPAYFNNIQVEGNTTVNDHVIYRNIRTRPGELYSKANVVRTVRELSQLNFFDQEKIAPEFKNVDPNAGTLDLNYTLAEKGSSQIQLQGGYGYGGFIGTVGLSFNNFSLRNLFNLKTYRPVPLGDGQQLSLSAQVSNWQRTYNISFTEPWLGGHRPIGLTVSLYQTTSYYPTTGYNFDRSRYFNLYGASVLLSKRLRKPDDFFVLSQGITYNYYALNNYTSSFFNFGSTGSANSLAYTISLFRDNSGPSPIYPMGGSRIGITAKLSPPYSLFDGIDYANLGNQPEYKIRDSEGNYLSGRPLVGTYANGDPDGVRRVTNLEDAAADEEKINRTKFLWLEFYKIKFDADWYLNIFGKFVLRASARFGILGAYNSARGIIPFERFFVGGSGLLYGSFDGRENIALRGYADNSLSDGSFGSSIYNKFSMELRHPVTLKPAASIYGLVFIDMGNAFESLSQFNPFDVKRSFGAGIRIFMPAFGLLGFDVGYGLDPARGSTTISGVQTHFIIGQSF